jgi:hypothetical protein
MNWIKPTYLPVVIVIILFGIILYYLFNRKLYLEGFGPQTWSTSTRDAFKKNLLSKTPTITEERLNSICDQYSKDFGVTDKDALYFIANKIWPWTETEKKLMFDNIKKQSGPGKTDAEIEKNIEDVQKNFPFGMAVLGSMGGLNNALGQELLDNKLMCKYSGDRQKNTYISEGVFNRDTGNNPTTHVKNEDIPKILPGFKFLQQPCNPCGIQDTFSSCAYSIVSKNPNVNKRLNDGQPILDYAWNTGPYTPAISSTTGSSVPGAVHRTAPRAIPGSSLLGNKPRIHKSTLW